MSCPACARAAADPTRDDYQARCFSCEARAMAAIGAHIESQQAGTVTPGFRAACERMWRERWQDGAREIKRWASLIDQHQARRRAGL